MEKKFQLPRPFAEQWLKDLRSGAFVQGKGNLFDNVKDEESGFYEDRFCCLGVAGYDCGIPKQVMVGRAYVDKVMKKSPDFTAYPEQLVVTGEFDDSLPNILMSLNDGNYHPDYNPLGKFFTFPEIADWVEENVAFIEPQKTK